MAVNPCCSRDLRSGTKIVAIIELVWYVFQLIIILGLLLFVAVVGVAAITSSSQNGSSSDKDHRFGLLAVGGILLVIFGVIFCSIAIVSIIFGVVLLKGSNNEQVGKVKAWLIFRVIMFFLSFLTLLLFLNVFALWEIFITPYFIWVGFAYMQQLKRDSVQGQGVVFSRPQEEKAYAP